MLLEFMERHSTWKSSNNSPEVLLAKPIKLFSVQHYLEILHVTRIPFMVGSLKEISKNRLTWIPDVHYKYIVVFLFLITCITV